MPTIHKIESLPEIKETLTSKSIWTQSLMRLRLEKLQKYSYKYGNYIYYCICIHPESSHNELNNNICSYNGEYCICSGFSSLEYRILVEITEADEFEWEIKDHSERDSFDYYNEFISWRKINAAKSC